MKSAPDPSKILKESSRIFPTKSATRLVGGGDDEVGVVHGHEVGGELAGEVVLVVQLLPAAQHGTAQLSMRSTA